jgi:MFS transporter, DHA1 family, inner membrane transport protein
MRKETEGLPTPEENVKLSDRTRWPVVLITVAGGIVAALHVGKVSPALPAVRSDLGLDLVQGGFVVSMFYVLGMALGLVVGVTADRLGRRLLIAAGFLFMGLGGVMGSMADGLPMLLASRFVEGIGFIGTVVAAPALVSAAASAHDRPLALSLWSIFTPAGMALALVVAPPILSGVGWRGLWLGVAALTVVAVAVIMIATRGLRMPQPPEGRPWRVAGETLVRPGLLLLSLAFGAYAFQWVTLMVWLPTFLAADMGATTTAAALLTALIVFLNIPSNVLGGLLLRRGVPRRVLIVGCAALMGLSAWGIFTPSLGNETRYALCLVFSFAGGFIPASLFAGVPNHAPSPGHMGAATGMLMQGSNLGQFVGPPFVAAAVAAAGGSWTGALAPLIGGAVLTMAAGLLAGHVEGGNRTDEQLRREQDGAARTPSTQGGKT